MAFAEKQGRSFTSETLKAVTDMIMAAEKLPPVTDATLQIMDPDTGLVIADIWWNGEMEKWMADMDFDPDNPDL